MIGEQLIGVILLALLALTAITIARLRSLLATAMLSGIFSLLGACWMLFLDAPDVAFTEAAVGAGISTILILATLCVVGAEEKQVQESPLALLVVLVAGGVLVYGTLDMPRFGDPNAPAHQSLVTQAYLYSANAPAEHRETQPSRDAHELETFAVGIPNTVTTVLASFRGYDTMGETAVIFTAGLGVVVILGGARHRRFEPSETVDITPSDERPEA